MLATKSTVPQIFIRTVLGVVVFALFLQTVPAIKAASAELSKVAFYETRAVVIGESALAVRVANTDARRQKGLSGSDPLEDKEGMLFVFDEIGFHGIWMKDMTYPIDIIWFDADKAVIHFEHNATPESYPKVFGPDEPSSYILEVPSGFIKKEGIRIGDYLSII